MTDTNEPLGGFLKDLDIARGPDGRLFKPEPTTGEELTVFDVYRNLLLTKPDDPLYKDKMTVVEAINNGFIEYTKANEKELLPIINDFANLKPEDVSPEDQHLFTEICKSMKEIDDTHFDSYMTKLFKKEPDIVSKILANVKTGKETPHKQPFARPSAQPSRLPIGKPHWKYGGDYKQNGGRVGIFESLKSFFGLDGYWRKTWGSSSIYTYFYERRGMFPDLYENFKLPEFHVVAERIKSFEKSNGIHISHLEGTIEMVVWLLFLIPKSVFLGVYKLGDIAMDIPILSNAIWLAWAAPITAVNIALVSPVIAMATVEVYALKPALLAVDLTVSSIVSLFRNSARVAIDGDANDNNNGVPEAEASVIGQVPIVEATSSVIGQEPIVQANIINNRNHEPRLAAGGSKKIRYRQKRTKKNKKNKRRNTKQKK